MGQGNPSALLVRIQSAADPLENITEFPQKIQSGIAF